MRKAQKSRIVGRNTLEHPYKKYKSHPYWKRIDKGISDLAENQDLVEGTAREYIVGYLCKTILKPPKKSKRRKRAQSY
jgi:hypothetical protein